MDFNLYKIKAKSDFISVNESSLGTVYLSPERQSKNSSWKCILNILLFLTLQFPVMIQMDLLVELS